MKWKPGQPLAMKSENYIIRSMRQSDLTERYQSWFKDPEVMEYFGADVNQTVDQMRQFLKSFDNKYRYNLGIFCKESGNIIGYFYVYPDFHRRVARTAVLIGDRDYWGKGVVIETRSVVFDFLFGVLGMERIWAWVDKRNIPAIFNYKAQGFQKEGMLRGHGVGRDGKRTDNYVFGLMRDEWHAHKAAKSRSSS